MFAGAGTNPGEKTLEDKFFEKEVSQSIGSHTRLKLKHFTLHNPRCFVSGGQTNSFTLH